MNLSVIPFGTVSAVVVVQERGGLSIMAKVGLILIGYRTDPAPLFDSVARSCHDLRWYIFWHGQDVQLRSQLAIFAQSADARFFPYGVNRGLARSWNDGIIASFGDGNDATILINDDLFFYEDGFDQFVDFILEQKLRVPDFGLIWVCGKETGGSGATGSADFHNKTRPQEAACMAIGRSAIDRIGYFDENFWPAYIEDYDYFYRIRLSGLPILCDERVLLEHNRSATARNDRLIRLLNQERWLRNAQYYSRKWGGRSLSETFKTPFNDETLNCFISAETRATPYGLKYDRTDLGSAETLGILQGSFGEELLGLLHRYASSLRRVVAWGSGDYTALVAEYAKAKGAEFLLSIDHNAERLRQAAARVPKYPFLHFRLIDGAGRGTGIEPDAAYIAYPFDLGRQFDLVIVAGKHPMDCALLAPSILAEGGLLIFHEEERVRHRAIRQHIEREKSADTSWALGLLDHWDRARDNTWHDLYDVVDETPQFVVLRPKRSNGTMATPSGVRR